jgi:hypothetical protein
MGTDGIFNSNVGELSEFKSASSVTTTKHIIKF